MKKIGVLIGFIVLILAVIILPNIMYHQGLDDGKVIGQVEAKGYDPQKVADGAFIIPLITPDEWGWDPTANYTITISAKGEDGLREVTLEQHLPTTELGLSLLGHRFFVK